MKQYDEIYVRNNLPQDETKLMVIGQGNECPLGGITEIKNVVVFTLEELRDMWEECRSETWQDARPVTKYERPDQLPGFEGYLQSKGINPLTP